MTLYYIVTTPQDIGPSGDNPKLNGCEITERIMSSEDKPAQPEVFESHQPKQSDLSALLYFKRFTALMLEHWSVDAIYLYDDEGVDGWRWQDAAGNDYYETGFHEELPEIPQEVERLADEIIARRKI